jgi:hypothetical protein
MRARIAAIAEDGDAGQACLHQCQKLLVHAQCHARPARGKQRDVARELQRVAKSLLGLDVNVLAGQAVALPGIFGKARPFAFAGAQPPLILVPALREVAAHQQKNAEPGMGIGVLRRQGDGAAQGRNPFVETAAMVQRGAEIGPGVGVIGVEFDGAAIGGDSLVEPAQRVQRVAKVAMAFGEIGIGRDRLALCARCFLVVFEFVKRDAEIAQGRRHVGVDLERAARLFDGEARAAGDAQHFTEIGME